MPPNILDTRQDCSLPPNASNSPPEREREQITYLLKTGLFYLQLTAKNMEIKKKITYLIFDAFSTQ